MVLSVVPMWMWTVLFTMEKSEMYQINMFYLVWVRVSMFELLDSGVGRVKAVQYFASAVWVACVDLCRRTQITMQDVLLGCTVLSFINFC